MKKVGEITRPFRYGLNQIPYDFTVEIRNRFKGRDIVQEAGIKTIPKKNKCKKAKWLSEEALQIQLRKEEKLKAMEKGKIYPFECRVPKDSKER